MKPEYRTSSLRFNEFMDDAQEEAAKPATKKSINLRNCNKKGPKPAKEAEING